jgi:hypothetical protein
MEFADELNLTALDKKSKENPKFVKDDNQAKSMSMMQSLKM